MGTTESDAARGGKPDGSIDSFSQLPFIRPAARGEKPPPSSSSSPVIPIRLFGFDVPTEAAAAAAARREVAVQEAAAAAAARREVAVQEAEDRAAAAAADEDAASHYSQTAGGDGDGRSGRKFECHYCCRNFPTSQALGGHQNAHKRERQHAKRAQFQSAMAMHHHHGHAHYYHALSDPAAYHHRFSPVPPPHYPSWAGAARSASSYYSGPGSISQPINGSPVAPPGLGWRPVPAVGTTMQLAAAARRQELPPPPGPPHTMSLAGGDQEPVIVVGRPVGSTSFSAPSTSSSSSSSASPHERRRVDLQPERKENVSLDLSL